MLRFIAPVIALVILATAPLPVLAFSPGACGFYTNSYGQHVPRPCGNARRDRAPPGASAVCRDGTYSFSRHRSGTCSGHGGVARWR